MKRIAIKYERENWSEVKKAVDLLRANNQMVIRRKDDISAKAYDIVYLCPPSFWSNVDLRNETDGWEYLSDKCLCEIEGFEILEMPRDYSRLEELLGVKQEVTNGSIWRVKGGEDWICRMKGDGMKTHFGLTPSDDYTDTDGDFTCGQRLDGKATPEEEAKLIEAEHKNGWHWDGSKLIKIPEYVKIPSGEIKKVNAYLDLNEDNIPRFTLCDHAHFASIGFIIENQSTKEAYEAQNKTNELESLKAENERLKRKLNEIREKCDS